MKQTTSTLLMIQPAAFFFNEETAENNYYQDASKAVAKTSSQDLALIEFNEFVDLLRANHIEVIVVPDLVENQTPDSIFPNNWVSFHENGHVFLYPMYAKSRRKERRPEILDQVKNAGFSISNITDLSSTENDGLYLEGTGSMIFDRANQIAYAARSIRTDENLFIRYCESIGYQPVVFSSFQTLEQKRLPIYHTNVMMCVADRYAVICLSCIDDADERSMVRGKLEKSGKTIIEISEEQVNQFAGNMLQVENEMGEKFLVMSDSACKSLTSEQLKLITSFNPILAPSLSTIETCGGGSARCMLAEVFLPKNR
ncbi:MAG: hypothetical protein RLY64_390 [Bacteroidota bacterium]|jgi:hypothetical protein